MRPAVVAQHARQFDDELPVRRAGSQEELSAAGYILGHLQQAGYQVRLEGVPIRNLVSSTNVVTVTDEARYAVAVVYDTGSEEESGEAIGTWLEIARAAAVGGPAESVQFVALGGEHADVDGGRLGSRRYAQILAESGVRPEVAIVVGPAPGRGLFLAGTLVPRLAEAGDVRVQEYPPSTARAAGDVLGRVAARWAVVGGDAQLVGEVVLGVLSDDG